MSENIHTRDVIVLVKGDCYPVTIDDAMRANGWAGGQGVVWVDSPNDDFRVSYSDGLFGGFLLCGSNEDSDQYTALTGQQVTYGYAIFCAGSWIVSTRIFERYTYTSRTGGGPLVPITYQESDRLVFSLRGLLTKEDEWTLAGDPRAPNAWYMASVVHAPTASNNWYLTVHTAL